ncbi:MAG: penicillin-binding protein 2 [bacterium]
MRLEPFDTQRHMIFSRRAVVLNGGITLLFGGLAYRLYQLQIRDYEKYAADADNNRFNQRIVVPLRGEIYDRFGIPLATNRQNFRVLIVAEDTEDVASSLNHLNSIVQLSEGDINRLMRNIRRKKAFTPIEVKDNLTWEQFAKINFQSPELPGLYSEVAETRNYPFGAATASVVGYVGAANERDMGHADEATKLLYRQPGFRLGRAGLERQFDADLRGSAGSITVQVNAHGRVIEEYPNEGDKPVQGLPQGLTIDAELQAEAMRILAEPIHPPADGEAPETVSASAVVLDVTNGDVLVMASTPSYDPNEFNVGISANKWRELNDSVYKPLLNKPVSGVYPPGSTFKLITAIAAQEAGVKPTRRFHCSGKLWHGNRYFNCWKTKGHGTLDMVGSIKHSCDVYYWQLAQLIDIDHLAEVARRFGLGAVHELGIGSQKAGIVPDRDWKKDYFRSTPSQQKWFPGETLSVAIGQGGVTSTPLQQAIMAARIATGRIVEPRLTRIRNNKLLPKPVFGKMNIDPSHMDVIKQGMDAVVNQWGTAARSRLQDPQWRMAGKTGTSQVISLKVDPVTGKRIKNEDLPWEQRDHALFVCFAPVENPQYACAVVVEHGSSGSRAAGPKARDIMTAVTAKNPSVIEPFNPNTDKPISLSSYHKKIKGQG